MSFSVVAPIVFMIMVLSAGVILLAGRRADEIWMSKPLPKHRFAVVTINAAGFLHFLVILVSMSFLAGWVVFSAIEWLMWIGLVSPLLSSVLVLFTVSHAASISEVRRQQPA